MLRTICTLQTVSYVTDSTVHTSQTVLYTSHRQCHSRVIDSTVNTSQAVPSTSHGQYHYGQYDIHVTGGIIHTSQTDTCQLSTIPCTDHRHTRRTYLTHILHAHVTVPTIHTSHKLPSTGHSTIHTSHKVPYIGHKGCHTHITHVRDITIHILETAP